MAASPPRLRVDLLGTPRLSAGERVTTRFETRRTALLLARLALPPLREWSRDELIELLWPDEDPVLTRTRLRQTLASLRRALEEVGTADEEVVLRASRASVALDVEQVASDVVELEACLRQASATPEQRREALDRALTLYENHLMPGFYETWVLSERERLESRMRTALLQLTQSLQETEPDAAITYARTAVNLDPLDETAQENLLKLLIQTGRNTEALRHWKDVERLFWKELRTTPPPTLKAALESVGAALPTPETVVVYSAAPERLLPRTLPAPLDAFFGRERERAQLADLLAETSVTRLVTLTGPPGVGKTRLALEVAHQLSHRNIVFVALESFPNGAAALEAIYDAAGGRHERGPLLPALTRLLDAYDTPLLVLDNAEGVQGIAEALQQLLQSVPELRCLVTSRQALRLSGEREMILEPLLTDTALRLLLDRARQARPDLSLTPQNEADFQGLCQDLDGLPLALELAAVWLRLLSPEQVRERLQKDLRLLARRGNEAGRHDSLYAAIEESIQRLRETERAILFRLSVFRGGWSLEAVEGTCEDLSPMALLDLETLRDASLIGVRSLPDGSQRFYLLETVRQYIRSHQAAAEWEQAQQHHLRYFCAYAESLVALYESPRQRDYIDGIISEYDNLQAALEYAIGSAPAEGARIAVALLRHWGRTGRLEHGLSVWERLKAVLPAEETFLHACLHDHLGRLLLMLFKYGEAIPHFQRSQELYRQAGDPISAAYAKCLEAAVRRDAYPESDHNDSFALFKEGQAVVEAQGTLAQKATMTLQEGHFYTRREEHQSARDSLERGLTLFRIVGSQRGVFLGLHWLAYAARGRGDLEEFVKLEQEAMEVIQRQDDVASYTVALWNLCLGLQDKKDFPLAEQHCHAGLAITRQHGMGWTEVIFLTELGRVQGKQGNHAQARRWFREGLKQGDTTGAIPHMMLNARWLTRLALRDAVAQPTRARQLLAAQLCGVLLRLEELMQLDQQYDFDGSLDELVSTIEAKLGRDTFTQEREKATRYERAEALLVLQLYPAEESR